MWAYIGKRLLSLIPVLLCVSFLTYSLLSLLPGDPALQILGMNASPESIAAVRDDLDLDRALPVRYVGWLGDVLRGNLGRSYQTNQLVTSAIRERLPVTIQIATMALIISLSISIPLGVLTAYRAGGRADRFVTGATFGLLSIPNFMLALVLIIIFAVNLGWLPATGWTRFSANPLSSIRSAFLPALTLAIADIAVFTRLLRTDMISTLQEDHVLLARSKGLPTRRILFRHALRPSSFSLMTVMGLQVGNLLGGSVIVEQVFALPGIGRLLLDSIFQRDLLIVQGVVLLVAVIYVLANFTVDILYTVLDPRIRHGAPRRARA